MYNLRSNKKDTIQFPVQIQVMDDEQFLTDLLQQNSSSFNSTENMSDSMHESSDSEVDYDALIRDSDSKKQSTSGKTTTSSHIVTSDNMDISSQLKAQSLINSKILEQLQKIGKRLDNIENMDCKKTSDKSKIKGAKGASKSKKLVSTKSDSKSDSRNETHVTTIPTFDSLREDAMIQFKVEQRLQELSELAKTGNTQKLKSQRGGQVEVLVKNRVKWPHEYVLSGLNKERVSCDQLSVTQWVAGFGRTMREESDPETRQYMLDYMISLMDDANDFLWISAKASHAVLLCRMEQGEVKSYSDVLAIDRIRRANAQKYVTNSVNISPQNQVFSKKFAKTTRSMPCTYFNQGTCLQKKSHETRGGGPLQAYLCFLFCFSRKNLSTC